MYDRIRNLIKKGGGGACVFLSVFVGVSSIQIFALYLHSANEHAFEVCSANVKPV